MRQTNGSWANGVAIAIIAGVFALILRANSHPGRPPRDDGRQGTPATSRDGLQQAVDAAQRRLRQQPTDASTAVRLADALLRQARVSGNAGLALSAEQALAPVLRDEPLAYEARRMLGTVYLSQHRFREAIREAERARDQQPRDDWNYGVMGDGHLELGEYEEAFADFQRMMDLRPTAGAYARAAYAFELRGHLDAALEAMKLSIDATDPNDSESLAWHHAQIGDLYRQLGRPEDAAVEYAWADHSFPGHPLAQIGLARVREAAGDVHGAVTLYEALASRAPSPDVAEHLGDLYAATGRPADAARQYALAETGWRVDTPQPASLARFLADHDRDLDEAVRLAESAARDRHDIFTEDALAWACFKAGRVRDARQAISRALRTGTRDVRIRAHASAIVNAPRTPHP